MSGYEQKSLNGVHWKITVSLASVISLWIIISGIFIAYGVPLLRSDPPPWVGQSRLNTTMDDVRRTVTDTANRNAALALRGQILSTWALLCAAKMSHISALTISYADTINGLQDDYEQVNSGRPFPLTDCVS